MVISITRGPAVVSMYIPIEVIISASEDELTEEFIYDTIEELS